MVTQLDGILYTVQSKLFSTLYIVYFLNSHELSNELFFYKVCFYWMDEVEARSIFILESTIDSIFAVDIMLNFFTAYSEDGIIITRPKLIALRYIKGFFFIDLIATIPFGYILTQSPIAMANKLGKLGRLPKMIRFARAARLLKLLRVYKVSVLCFNSVFNRKLPLEPLCHPHLLYQAS